MKLQKDNILIVGAGNMGFAFITALLDTKVAAKQISVLENNPSQELKKLTKLKKLNLISSIAMLDIKKKISIVLLAIKPNQVNNIFTDDFNIRINKSLLISIVAGKTMASLKKLSNGNINIARAMTNTPVTVGWGTSIVYFSKNFSARNKQKVIHLFDLVGQVEEVKNEKYINTFTALFGSGPAYLYLFLETWSEVAKKNGFKFGEEMAVQTMLGSLLLLLKTQDDPKILRNKVTSKGGTTEAGLEVFLKNKVFSKLFTAAVSKATKRAVDLSKS
tara:strand:+ start:3969 stop:4793 length:825 start_codon:yes stop_codon:yes gene_type:complete